MERDTIKRLLAALLTHIDAQQDALAVLLDEVTAILEELDHAEEEGRRLAWAEHQSAEDVHGPTQAGHEQV